ncbi:hypothetical protein LCGC14_1583790 [marine sediment metagenome]|uniref:Uncharacterized protein n=1 Tax=marine sediment metagenome TaxID=412755 RepID=A0A0F9IGC6_9ZZZZ
METRKAQKYCIKWKNNRGATHTGPVLMASPANTTFLYDLLPESLGKIELPRPRLFEEAQTLADNMNTSPEFNNQSHTVVIYRGKKRADKPAPKGAIEGFTPVFQLPSVKTGRPRMEA